MSGDLSQARIVKVTGPNPGARLDEAQIKRVTGGVPITCRELSVTAHLIVFARISTMGGKVA